MGITDEIGGGITYGYDGLGNTVSVADAHGRTVRYGYDVLGLLVSETELASNGGQSTAAATRVLFYDDGSLIGTAELAELDTAEQATASITWDIQGQGRENTRRVAVNPVGEFDTGNNGAEAVVLLPGLHSEVTVTPSRIEVGGTVAVSLWLENLQAAAGLPVTATVQIRSPLGAVVHEQAWSQTLSGAETKQFQTSWQTEAAAVPGTYSVLQGACDRYGECYLNRSSFIVGTVETRFVYLPVVLKGQTP